MHLHLALEISAIYVTFLLDDALASTASARQPARQLPHLLAAASISSHPLPVA
jgi:hypothetical protein